MHKAIAGAAAAALLIAGGVALWKKPSEPPLSHTPKDAIAPSQVGTTAGSVQADSAADPAPWEVAPTTNAAATSAARRPVPANALLTNSPVPLSIAQMDQQIALREEQTADLLKQLDLAQSQGKLPPDLNADAVRTNLHVALKAQKLGRELVQLTQQPSTPERQQRMSQITAQMTSLQRELRTDVTVATMPAGASR